LERSVAFAKTMTPGDGPIVLLDYYDNCASGGTMDTTVLAEARARRRYRICDS